MNIYKSFSVYTLTSFLEKGLAFLVLPIFTYYLSPNDYGTLALLTSLWFFILPIISLGTQGAISVAYFNETKENYSSYVSSSLLVPLFIMSVILLVCLAGGDFIAEILNVPWVWIVLIPPFAFLSMLSSTLLIDYQVKQEVFKYGIFSISNSAVNIGLSLFFVVVIGLNYEGRLLGQYISVIIFALIAIFLLYRRGILTRHVTKMFCKDSLAFGLPLVPHVIGGLFINMSDRIFINQIVGKDALGIYNTGYVLASSISVLCAAFANAIVPYSYDLFTRGDHRSKEQVVKVYWIFIVILGGIVLLFNMFVPYIFDWFINIRYHGGIVYARWISWAFFFQGCYLLFANIIFYTKKTSILFYLSFVNIAVNLLLNHLLIHKYGTIGAAYTICISYFIFFISVALLSKNLLPLPWFFFIKRSGVH